MYQCADTTRIARGLGAVVPNDCHAFVKRLVSRAFIGLPWPKKAAGIRALGVFCIAAEHGTRSSRRLRPTFGQTSARGQLIWVQTPEQTPEQHSPPEAHDCPFKR